MKTILLENRHVLSMRGVSAEFMALTLHGVMAGEYLGASQNTANELKARPAFTHIERRGHALVAGENRKIFDGSMEEGEVT